MNPYFGTDSPLPAGRWLQAGQLTCLYESGWLRYIRTGSVEVVRLLYAVVRDQHWLTLPWRIENETIREADGGFAIAYTGWHERDDIRYRMDVTISGTADNAIHFEIDGLSSSSFQRNRIGICVHHPLVESSGKAATVTTPGGQVQIGHFPTHISPHQPFLGVQRLAWEPAPGLHAALAFTGDVFETEDQRNWGDASFKTYGTPLADAAPVAVRPGDTVRQTATLQVTGAMPAPAAAESIEIHILTGQTPFPRIGYGRSGQPLSEEAAVLLRQLRFDHYRVEIRFEEAWEHIMRQALTEAAALAAPLELVVFLGEPPRTQLETLLAALPAQTAVASLLLLSATHAVTPDTWLPDLLPLVRKALPDTRIGTGTDQFFADLNRQRPATDNGTDFISFPATPQVHLWDTRTVTENLEALSAALETAGTFAAQKAVHVSPVTLRMRHYPEDQQWINGVPAHTDTRLHTQWAAAWTLLALRHLAGAAQVTLYETTGMCGLLPGATPAGAAPVYQALRTLHALQPAYVLATRSAQPLLVDALLLHTHTGTGQGFLVNFSPAVQAVQVKGAQYTLPPESITEIGL